ncbi:cytochrome P450 [Zopfia rhizophila CBS 207.26]|uniref:Cytochrome P450 n=1 Tax=Zopfia rhizophila CBS 207.26 TaxID=1314779 RepID=A0A6A6ECQ5_9PEZI|nr:cytochrome P450 [Zopfia rhizophila CBS 207.26]
MTLLTHSGLFDAFPFLWDGIRRLKFTISSMLMMHHIELIRVLVEASLVLSVIYLLHRLASYDDGIPIVNRRFALEPRIFSRIRWAAKPVKILDEGDEKYGDRAYRLARGDADIVVLPTRFITELNKLPQQMISSKKSHYISLTAYLNGMDVVLKTSHHVKLLLSRITPALPVLLKPASGRIQRTITEMFPQDTVKWTTVQPLDKVVHCISQAITLITFGEPVCDNPKLVRLCYEHTYNVFSTIFIMRLFPRFLQPILVWLLPHKWRLERSWKELTDFVVSEVRSRKDEKDGEAKLNVLSWSFAEAEIQGEGETYEYMLTRLVGSIIAGGTYSSAAFITGVIADLVNDPQSLGEIRQEIREKNNEVKGNWDQAAYNSLDKLESAMKETLRLAPGSLLLYSRVMESDYTLSNGLQLKKGELITTSGRSISTDANLFPDPKQYKALRAYNTDLERHRAQPFRSVDSEDMRWGSGRWACPGRYIASLMGKVILVKLLDEYDFKFIGGKRPPTSILHEFVFMDPSTKFLMRRRERNSGIEY